MCIKAFFQNIYYNVIFSLLLLSIGCFLLTHISYAANASDFSSCLKVNSYKYDEQINSCKQLLRLHKKKEELHLALGKALTKQQRYKEAVQVYQKAYLLFPDDNNFRDKLSMAKSNLKEQEWVKANKKKTQLAKSKSSSSVQYKLKKLRCTRLSGKAALIACNEAIKLNAEDASLLVRKGDIYSSQKKLRRANSAYKKALKINPKDKSTSVKLAKIVKQQKKINQALAKRRAKAREKAQTKIKLTKILDKAEKPVLLVSENSTAEANKSQVKSVPASNFKQESKENTGKLFNQESVQKELGEGMARKDIARKDIARKDIARKDITEQLNLDQRAFLSQLNLLKSLSEQKLITQQDYESRKTALIDANFRIIPSANVQMPPKKRVNNFDTLDFGRYHALVIGNNQYDTLPLLETAVGDAKSMAKVLKNYYGFEVRLLLNANRYDTLKAMGELRRSLTKNDNLLIYYAGHGVLDKESERGYWLPVDSEEDFTSNWISTADITDTLKALKAKHVLVVADSCYSGTLVRNATGINLNNPTQDYALIKRLLAKKSRTVITSGGLEPVTDSGGEGHSIFAQAILDVLIENNDVIVSEQLFSLIRNKVILNADQTPEYSNVRKVGHNGGDFIFVRK